MFNFFKSGSPDTGISFEDFVFLVDVLFRTSGPRTLFYAHAGGYEGDTILTDHGDYLTKLRTDYAGGAYPCLAFAFDYLINELDGQLSREKWPTFQNLFKHEPDYGHMEEIVSRWPRAGIHPAVQDVREAWSTHVIEKASAQRELDHAMLRSLVDTKWAVLQPLLKKSVRDGVDRWGEQSYEGYFTVCRDFVERFICEADLRFYAPLSVWHPLTFLTLAILNDEHSGGNPVREIPSDGVQFEHWCAERLIHQGWTVRITKASGDQGTDLVARRGATSVAIQCKRYASPIGNGAVQEIYAGQVNELCTHACVIGTGGFTRAAHELARSTRVRLLDASDIDTFGQFYRDP